jgi:cell division protein FtsN
VYRVVIGGFGDKSAANEMCNELKEIAGFKDAFVKVL